MRKPLSLVLVALSFMLFPLTSARADAVCAGPWLEIKSGGPEWSQESSCRCQLNGSYVRGGVLTSTFGWGYLWSEGRGVVKLVLEVERVELKTSKVGVYMHRANGQRFEAANGNGISEAMFFPPPPDFGDDDLDGVLSV